jgi:hypothetical protein
MQRSLKQGMIKHLSHHNLRQTFIKFISFIGKVCAGGPTNLECLWPKNMVPYWLYEHNQTNTHDERFGDRLIIIHVHNYHLMIQSSTQNLTFLEF